MPDNRSIGARLRAERKARIGTVRAMAEALRGAASKDERVRLPKLVDLTRTIRGWEAGEHRVSERYRLLICRALGMSESDLFGQEVIPPPTRTTRPGEIASSLTTEAIDLAVWAEQTSVGDMTIDIFTEATRRLASDYLRKPPVPVLNEAISLYRRVSELLRGGRQHLNQARDLHIVAGQLLAFLSWAASDLGQPAAADAYARGGWVMADQADHDDLRARALIAQSKNAFWENRFHEAAEYATRGLEYAPASTTQVLLACQLGDARQALGDVEQARQAHEIATRARDAIAAPDDVGGLWTCGRARQANYAVGVHLRAGDSAAAHDAASQAEEAYEDGEQWAYGTWAQIRIGDAIAHLLDGEVHGAATSLAPILEMPAEQRLATLTTRLGEVDHYLADRRYAGSANAGTLRDQIAHYRDNPITTRALPPGEE